MPSHGKKEKYIAEGVVKRTRAAKLLPKGIFYGSEKIYIASIANNGKASGFRTDITMKAIECVAHYLHDLKLRTGKDMALKTPFGVLRLDTIEV
jgi:hypothetical protein